MGLRLACMAIALVVAGCHRLGPGGTDTLRREGKQLWTTKGCIGCHTLGAAGTPIAPDLQDIGRKFSVDALARWLRNPAAQVPNAHMPQLVLTEHEIDALVIYLASHP